MQSCTTFLLTSNSVQNTIEAMGYKSKYRQFLFLNSTVFGVLFSFAVFFFATFIGLSKAHAYCNGLYICGSGGNLYNSVSGAVHICQSGISPIDGLYHSGCGSTGNCACFDGGTGQCYDWEGKCCYEAPEYCGGGGGTCFLPGTQVATPQGDEPIETLKPGDAVFSFDELTGKRVLNTVQNSPVRTVQEYYIIKTQSGREVKTTAEHPFLTKVGSQRDAGAGTSGKLEALGDLVRLIRSKLVSITGGLK